MNPKVNALHKAQPLNVLLELTYACNWRCVFCYNPRHFDRKRMSAEEWSVVLDDLRELGSLNLVLSGGEPLAHPEFFQIAEAARARAFAIRIFTNGSLIDDATAARIAPLRPLAVEISLHGATADVHDATTGKRGSFEALVRGVEALKNHGVRVTIKTPVTKINEHQFEDIARLVHSWGLEYRFDATMTPRDDGDASPLQYRVSPETLRKLTEVAAATGSLATMNRVEGGFNCGLGRLTMAIDPEGNVFPCPQWRHRAMGNVRETPLREMWPNSLVRIEAAKVARDANDRLVEMGGAAAEFSFCPALAYEQTGDPLTPDAAFLERAAIAAEVRDALRRGIV